MKTASYGFEGYFCSLQRQIAQPISLHPPFEPYCGLCLAEWILDCNQMTTSSTNQQFDLIFLFQKLGDIDLQDTKNDSMLKARSKIQKQILEIKRNPTKRQTRKVPLKNKLLGQIRLKIHLCIYWSIATIQSSNVAIKCFFTFFYTHG